MFDIAMKEGLRFECTQCSHCCAGSPGFVWLSGEDAKRLCEFLDISHDTLIEKYCVLPYTDKGIAVSLREKARHECVFLEAGKCSVYSARPLQCRTYPFWDEIVSSEASWLEEGRHCPGIGHGEKVSSRSIMEAIVAGRTNHRLILGDESAPERKN